MSTTALTRGSGEVERSLSRDDLFEVLSNRRRRYVLHYLCRREEESVELSDLVTQVAAWENGTDPEQLSYDDRKSVHISLYQHHVPKMDEAGVVDYDQRGGVVELRVDPDEIAGFLRTFERTGIRWELYFPALSAVVAPVILLAAADAVPGPVPGVAWASLAVAAVVASSLAFLYDVRSRSAIEPDAPPPELDGE
jgi:DNA-binding transcriptional ArsR family regulator